MKTLFLITARGGSKGLPDKNIRVLNGKPLIYYTIDAARMVASDEDICVSTDSEKIINVVENAGLNVPFVRPKELATDYAGHHGVILHALEFYKQIGKNYDNVMLLQPTSPLRKKDHLVEVLELFDDTVDMVASVCKSKVNPSTK